MVTFNVRDMAVKLKAFLWKRLVFEVGKWSELFTTIFFPALTPFARTAK